MVSSFAKTKHGGRSDDDAQCEDFSTTTRLTCPLPLRERPTVPSCIGQPCVLRSASAKRAAPGHSKPFTCMQRH